MLRLLDARPNIRSHTGRKGREGRVDSQLIPGLPIEVTLSTLYIFVPVLAQEPVTTAGVISWSTGLTRARSRKTVRIHDCATHEGAARLAMSGLWCVFAA